MPRREPRNRAERRALERIVRKAEKVVKARGRIGVKTRFTVLDADGRDVTAERMTVREVDQ